MVTDYDTVRVALATGQMSHAANNNLRRGSSSSYVFECPAVEDIRRRHSRLFDDSRSGMRMFMWHSNQKGVASCLLQTLESIDGFLD